jgi:magnesium transporter
LNKNKQLPQLPKNDKVLNIYFPMVKILHKTIKEKELKEIDGFRIGSWINVESPEEKELDDLAKNLSLEKGLLMDAVDPYEVPRLEIDNGVIYIFTRVPDKENDRVITEPLMIAIGKDFVITTSSKPLTFLKKFLNNEINFTTTQKTKLVLQFFSEIIAVYNNFLTSISKNVRSTSVQMEKIGNKDIVQFVNFEGVINDFLAALVPTNTILNNLLNSTASRRLLELYEEDKDLIEDLFLSNNQLIELCKANLKTIVNIREAYSTIMTNNLNRVIKFFTALTIILTVPMIVSSFYGMNINLPFAEHPMAFWGILITTLVVSFTLLAIFFRKRWL